MDNDLKIIMLCYGELVCRVNYVRKNILRRPMTLAEKIMYAHLYNEQETKVYTRGEAYANFRPDRVAMQDATAQMALLQFMNAKRKQTAVLTSVHCDHLIRAYQGEKEDMKQALATNREVYDFLQSVCDKYGITFWKPGAGIIHQVVLENYAFPGGMMIGTDSHTPNAGGLGMIAIGVGGADAVDVMIDMPWELKMPRLIGVHLTGKLSGWASPKDVILKLAGLLTVKGGTNHLIEYFGEGAVSLSATGKATICNMGAEVGATTSLFPYDEEMCRYLCATGREAVVQLANNIAPYLQPDKEVLKRPERYFDQVIEIDLSSLEPYINGPFTPDAATPISAFADKVRTNGYPEKVEAGLIGSCTNSSYQDLARSASLARQAIDKHIPVATPLYLNPGSAQIVQTAERDRIIGSLEAIGALRMANACGPCIGQWKRVTDDHERPNSIVTSYNRNFAKRTDGNPNSHVFVASPELTLALTLAGRLTFNPLTDKLQTADGTWVMLDPPTGHDLPPAGFVLKGKGLVPPTGQTDIVEIDPSSDRLQRLEPFAPWNGDDQLEMLLLLKAKGKCTTDHISMAGPWLRFRGHLDNISDNLLMGAVNAFNGKTNTVQNRWTGHYESVASIARKYKAAGCYSLVVAEENYGEGSSREHAAMEPRYLNVRLVLAKSFARIHETNLKKQGMLALTFVNPADYERIRESDQVCLSGLAAFSPGVPLQVNVRHTDGTTLSFDASHSYNDMQIAWFRAGSALNYYAKYPYNG